MRNSSPNMWSAAAAALLSVPFAGGAALAQESNGTDQTQQSQETAQRSSQPATGSGQTEGGPQQDQVVATVGETEIRGSDVMTVIGLLPPQMQSQPPQMLVPMALQQLILRELILEEARAQNLSDDPDVVALVEGSAQTAEEDAMVKVWLDRELADVVTDESVQQVYEQAQAQGQQDLPPIEEARPQIEQLLMQQAMQEIQSRLRQGAEIVLYDPAGQPVEQPQDGGAQAEQTSQSEGGGTADDMAIEDASPE